MVKWIAQFFFKPNWLADMLLFAMCMFWWRTKFQNLENVALISNQIHIFVNDLLVRLNEVLVVCSFARKSGLMKLFNSLWNVNFNIIKKKIIYI